MEHRIEHDLQPELARKAVQRAIEDYTQRYARYQPEVQWLNEDRVKLGFTAKGFRLGGEVRVESRAIVLGLDVPLLLRPFRRTAIDLVEAEVKRWIERARNGAL